MKVIVFGGTGWVGHSIVCELAAAGHDVTVGSRGRKRDYMGGLPRGIRTLIADKNNASDMASVFSERYDAVVDSVPTVESVDLVVRHARWLKRYLHCSSTGGYAPLPYVPGDETMPFTGFFGGGWKAKVVVDAKALDLFMHAGFPATVIRPCYITGPGLLPLDNLGGRRADFIRDIVDGVPLDLPNDGQALLQPIHVKDLARSFLLALEQPLSIGQVYNICLEKAVPLNQYLEITAAAVNRKVAINYVPLDEMLRKYQGRVHETGLRFLATHMCFDISKARRDLGYAPRYTTAAAIEETARWSFGPE
jgi:nucleoside-diphosphate-sugar epimerase